MTLKRGVRLLHFRSKVRKRSVDNQAMHAIHPRHHTETEPKMQVPYTEILRFNTWASMQITLLNDCPVERDRLESVLYGIPIVDRLTRDDYIRAVEKARFSPNVPASVYAAFQSYKPW